MIHWMSIHPNITRLYFIKIAKWFMLYMPIVVPFYESNSLSMKDIMVLQAVYSIAIVMSPGPVIVAGWSHVDQRPQNGN